MDDGVSPTIGAWGHCGGPWSSVGLAPGLGTLRSWRLPSPEKDEGKECPSCWASSATHLPADGLLEGLWGGAGGTLLGLSGQVDAIPESVQVRGTESLKGILF